MSRYAHSFGRSIIPVLHSGVLRQMVAELLEMFGLPEDTPVTIPGFHYRDPTLADPGVLTLRQALTSCYDIRCADAVQAIAQFPVQLGSTGLRQHAQKLLASGADENLLKACSDMYSVGYMGSVWVSSLVNIHGILPETKQALFCQRDWRPDCTLAVAGSVRSWTCHFVQDANEHHCLQWPNQAFCSLEQRQCR